MVPSGRSADAAPQEARRAPPGARPRARLASGEAAVALLSSEEAAAGAASAAGLEVVWPDQDGRGAVLLPRGGSASGLIEHAPNCPYGTSNHAVCAPTCVLPPYSFGFMQ